MSYSLDSLSGGSIGDHIESMIGLIDEDIRSYRGLVGCFLLEIGLGKI